MKRASFHAYLINTPRNISICRWNTTKDLGLMSSTSVGDTGWKVPVKARSQICRPNSPNASWRRYIFSTVSPQTRSPSNISGPAIIKQELVLHLPRTDYHLYQENAKATRRIHVAFEKTISNSAEKYRITPLKQVGELCHGLGLSINKERDYSSKLHPIRCCSPTFTIYAASMAEARYAIFRKMVAPGMVPARKYGGVVDHKIYYPVLRH